MRTAMQWATPIIARFGRYLQASLSSGAEMVGRVGSEEYLAVVDGADRDVLDSLTSDLLTVRLTIDGEGPSGESTSVSLIAGAGVVSWDGDSVLTPAALIHQAEVALRKAKQLGRSRRYAFETDDAEFARLREDMRLSMELSVEIGDALERGEFEAFFQPLYSPSSGLIVGAEALARWRHPVARAGQPRRVHPAARAQRRHRRSRPVHLSSSAAASCAIGLIGMRLSCP